MATGCAWRPCAVWTSTDNLGILLHNCGLLLGSHNLRAWEHDSLLLSFWSATFSCVFGKEFIFRIWQVADHFVQMSDIIFSETFFYTLYFLIVWLASLNLTECNFSFSIYPSWYSPTRKGHSLPPPQPKFLKIINWFDTGEHIFHYARYEHYRTQATIL